uniref:Uncharacterized protein n=1 Tax=Micrurus lemniscatus lemniscatus TaxID=129467 RepID=A0A2D4HKV9_MICLE
MPPCVPGSSFRPQSEVQAFLGSPGLPEPQPHLSSPFLANEHTFKALKKTFPPSPADVIGCCLTESATDMKCCEKAGSKSIAAKEAEVNVTREKILRVSA